MKRESVAQDGGDEVLRRDRRESLVERRQHQAIDAERGKQARLGVDRRQAEYRGLGTEEGARMRLEGERHRGHAEAVGVGAGVGEQRLVAAMDAVEIAHRHHPALQRVGDAVERKWLQRRPQGAGHGSPSQERRFINPRAARPAFARSCMHLAEIGRLACAEIGGVDAAGDKQDVNPLPHRAAHVGLDGVADGEHRLRTDRFADDAGDPLQCRFIDGRMGFADHDRFAAQLAIALRRALRRTTPACRRARPRCRGWRRSSARRAPAQPARRCLIVVGGLGLVVEEPGAGDDVARLLVAEGERQAVIDPQVALGADMEDAFARLCREDAAGRIA